MKSIAFDTKIIIYWLYKNYIRNALYCVFCDGKLVGKTTKTHFTFDNLNPDTIYKIQVFNNDTLLFEEDIKTKKSKKVMNVLTIDPSIDTSGKELVTKKIQKILNLANKYTMIYFPKGEYLCGALFVKSDTEIYLEDGALIKGSVNPLDYLPKIPSRFEGIELPCYASLINIGHMNHNDGFTTHDAIIRGKGSIIGGGASLCNNIIERELPECGDKINAGRRRNRLINISNSQNIIIEGLNLGYSSSWNIHMIYSDNVVTTNCKITSKHYHNGDGWDPDSSSNCTLFNCEFDVGDDMFAIKSGKNPEGNIVNIPSHDINIFDCKSIHSHGAAIGSEMSGGVYNVFVWDLDMSSSMHGLHIKATKKRGGYVKNVIFDNCKAPVIFVESNVNYNDDGDGAKEIPTFSNFEFKNIELNGIICDSLDNKMVKPHISIIGFEEDESKVNNIVIENITYLNNGLEKENYVFTKYCKDVIIK